jgi:hypothetical protein
MPRASLVEKRARALCVELARVTGYRPMQYRMVRLIARSVALDYKTADAAIAYSVEKGRLFGKDKPPHRCAGVTVVTARPADIRRDRRTN